MTTLRITGSSALETLSSLRWMTRGCNLATEEA
jgi:hypothetical protein